MLGKPIEMLVPERFRANHPNLRGSFFGKPGLAPDGRGPRPLRPEEGRQRVSDRDRLEPDRDGRRPDGALGHRRHHLAQAPRRALPPGGRVGAERHGHDQQRAARSRWSMRRPNACSATRARRCSASRSRCWCPSAFAQNHPKLRGSFFGESGLAPDGRGPRPVRPEEGRQRVSDRDRPEPDRDGRRARWCSRPSWTSPRASGWRSASARSSSRRRTRWS